MEIDEKNIDINDIDKIIYSNEYASALDAIRKERMNSFQNYTHERNADEEKINVIQNYYEEEEENNNDKKDNKKDKKKKKRKNSDGDKPKKKNKKKKTD